MSNITENKLNQLLTQADVTAIHDNIVEVLNLLPKMSLTPEQRGTMLSMDVDNKVFAEDCMNEVVLTGAGIIPPYIVPANMKNDIEFYEQLDGIEIGVQNLTHYQKYTSLHKNN